MEFSLAEIAAGLNAIGITSLADLVLGVVALAGLSTMFPWVRRKLLGGNGKYVTKEEFEKHREEDHKKWTALATEIRDELREIRDDIRGLNKRVDGLADRK